MVVILTDVFRRADIGGWSKAAWCVFLIVLPFLGVLCYLIARGSNMQERQYRAEQAQDREFQSYVRDAAGSANGGPPGNVTLVSIYPVGTGWVQQPKGMSANYSGAFVGV